MARKIPTSPAFKIFALQMIQDYEMLGSMDDVIRFGLRGVASRSKEFIPELTDYLRTILEPSVSDAELAHLWNSSNEAFLVTDRGARWFFRRILGILEEDAPNGVLKQKLANPQPVHRRHAKAKP
ncbi:hypothetical protein BJF93_16715 [Xaviernesmea oryzae]|uniref:Uncharacterized protein n=1 Tax=Xaviernesmea oryzae TaxID=464029 RepID=A0A1Q9ASZ5_9HYPH|nr:hypothetical protein [Xaviernesmea oryzae]OLP58506.1 hypothetical protein BJF93_16715 [Xaviernesmea oryzae]SEK59703.1 hypothetical protein SAMN04487976_10347 [Xaviernesmea oryzae]